jgi:acyl transferase domain-containing protein
MTEIAVVGMGIAVPGASSPGDFWQLLNTGQPQFSEPGGNYRPDSFWSGDPDAEDRTYVRVSGFLTGLRLHPRLATEVTDGLFTRDDGEAIRLRHCLLQAGDTMTTRDSDRGCCVIGGTGLSSQRLDEAIVIEAAAHNIAAQLQDRPSADDPDKADTERLRSLLRHHFGHTGMPPAQLLADKVVHAAVSGLLPGDCAVTVVDTACSSALYAIDLGAKHLLAGDCEIAYCGGLSGVTPRYNIAFAKLGGLSRRGRLSVFDRNADGTLFSEAAAVVALKTLGRALEDGDPVLGVLAGFGASSDGRGRWVCAPSPAGQSLSIERAQRAAGLAAGQVDWVVAHGTGTTAGDAAELAALAEMAPPAGRLCASNKPVVGHTTWCAGAVSVIHALLALRHDLIPAHHGFITPAPGSPAGTCVEIPVHPRPWISEDGQPRTVGVSSFGFGGTNGHLLIREHVPRPATPAAAPADPVVLVAWAAHLPGEPSRAEIGHMLTTGAWTCPRTFGRYEPPPFDEIRLPARAAQSTDPSQLMALHLMAMMVAEYGELWAPLHDTTGVIAARSGPMPLAVGNLLRCYAAELERAVTDEDAKALAAFLADVREESPPTNKHTVPGIMPNIMPARLANHYDLHGLTMLVDSGHTSGYTALDVAALYLATGELDVALVLAVNLAVPAGLARLANTDPSKITEGAFLLALTRSSVARRHGWQVHTEIPRGTREPVGPVRTETSFLAADAVVSLLETLHRNSS